MEIISYKACCYVVVVDVVDVGSSLTVMLLDELIFSSLLNANDRYDLL